MQPKIITKEHSARLTSALETEEDENEIQNNQSSITGEDDSSNQTATSATYND